jgi:hypothetical protein
MSVIAGSSPIITMMGIIIAILFLLCTYLLDKMSRGKRFGYFAQIMGECAKKNRPLGLIIDRSGTIIPIEIEKNEKNKGLIKHELTLVHPDMSPSNTKMRIRNGPETVIYPMPFFFPFNVHSAAALTQVAENIRKDPDFNWMPSELRIIELLFNGTETFERNAVKVIHGAIVNGYPLPESWYTEAEKAEDEEAEEDEEDETEEEEIEEETEEIEEEDEEEESAFRGDKR